jgi:uncharacterized protein
MNREQSPAAAAGDRRVVALASGTLIGALGGLIGLGGAEFRLPLLIGLFRFAALEAVIMNKAMSLIVVASALPFRIATVPFSAVAAHWTVIANLLAGSLAGSWFGAGWATKLLSESLYKLIAALLVVIAGVLLVGHDASSSGQPLLGGSLQIAIGIVTGFAIGVVASLLGVAGGELLIPTLVLLFGCDIKLAGSLSLAVSLPTMLIGFTRYSRDQSFSVLSRNKDDSDIRSFGNFFYPVRNGETMIEVMYQGPVDKVVAGSAGDTIHHPPGAVVSSTPATACGQTRG